MKLKKLGLLVAAALSLPAAQAAATDSDQLAQLQQRVAELESKAQLSSWSERLHISGFASIGAGFSKEGAGYAFYSDKDLDFTQESLFALQTSFAISPRMEATLQLISRGSDDWKVKAEWAFVSYELNESSKLRAGKLRLPLYMLSDYLEVGYAYPFVRPSEEVYGVAMVSAYNGIELLHTVDFDESSLLLQPIFGQIELKPEQDFVNIVMDMDNVYGLAATYEWDALTLRSSYVTGKTDMAERLIEELPFNPDNQQITFVGAGLRYDADSWLLMSEFTRLEVDGVYPDTDSYYVALAYRIGAVTPYLMYSHIESKDDDERRLPAGSPLPSGAGAEVMNLQRSTYSVGARWDVMPNVALKLDVSYTDDFGDTHGILSGNGDFIEVGGQTVPATVQRFDDEMLTTVKLDLVF